MSPYVFLKTFVVVVVFLYFYKIIVNFIFRSKICLEVHLGVNVCVIIFICATNGWMKSASIKYYTYFSSPFISLIEFRTIRFPCFWMKYDEYDNIQFIKKINFFEWNRHTHKRMNSCCLQIHTHAHYFSYVINRNTDYIRWI